MKQPLSDIETTLPARVPREGLVRPLGLPARSRRFYRNMGSVYMVGAGMLVGAGVALGSIVTGGLWGFAIGMFGLVLLGGARAPEQNQKLLEKLDDVRSQRAQRLLQLFRVLEFPPTVEEIAARLRWKQSAVIDGLRELVDSGGVTEDIHFETGEWTYAVPGTKAASIQLAGSTDSLSLQIEYAYDELVNAKSATPGDAANAQNSEVEETDAVDAEVVEEATASTGRR